MLKVVLMNVFPLAIRISLLKVKSINIIVLNIAS